MAAGAGAGGSGVSSPVLPPASVQTPARPWWRGRCRSPSWPPGSPGPAAASPCTRPGAPPSRPISRASTRGGPRSPPTRSAARWRRSPGSPSRPSPPTATRASTTRPTARSTAWPRWSSAASPSPAAWGRSSARSPPGSSCSCSTRSSLPWGSTRTRRRSSRASSSSGSWPWPACSSYGGGGPGDHRHRPHGRGAGGRPAGAERLDAVRLRPPAGRAEHRAGGAGARDGGDRAQLPQPPGPAEHAAAGRPARGHGGRPDAADAHPGDRPVGRHGRHRRRLRHGQPVAQRRRHRHRARPRRRRPGRRRQRCRRGDLPGEPAHHDPGDGGDPAGAVHPVGPDHPAGIDVGGPVHPHARRGLVLRQPHPLERPRLGRRRLRRHLGVAGVRSWQVLLVAYTISGLFAAVGGILLAGQAGAVDLRLAQNFLLPSVAAAVIGGTSIFGGVGTYSGTILGALILSVPNSMLTFLDAGQAVKQVVYGSIVLVLAWFYAAVTRAE